MPEVQLACEAAGCDVVKKGDTMRDCIDQMTFHQKHAHEAEKKKQKAPAIDRPEITEGMAEDKWETLLQRWVMFKAGTDIEGREVPQLVACCPKELGDRLHAEDKLLASRSEDHVLQVIKAKAVIKVPLTSRRIQLLEKVIQDPSETIQQFVSRIKSQANVCEWTAPGPCGSATCKVDYTDEIVKLVAIKGLADDSIKKEILGTDGIDDKSLQQTITLIDSKEVATRAVGTTSSVAATAYARQRKAGATAAAKTKQEEIIPQVKCSCGKMYPQTGRIRGRLMTFRSCRDCHMAKISSRPKSNEAAKSSENSSVEVDALFHCIAAVGSDAEPQLKPNRQRFKTVKRGGRVAIKPVDHLIFDGTLGWRKADAAPHSTMKVSARIDKSSFAQLGMAVNNKPTPIDITAVADSGAQTCLMSLKLIHRMGLTKKDLIPVKKRLKAANNEEITILGSTFLHIGGYDGADNFIDTPVICYVTSSTDRTAFI